MPNLATEDTYGDGGEDDARGRHEDGVGEVAAAKRFVAGIVEGSSGARVRARVEEEIMTAVKCVFIGTGAALRYYTCAPGDSHLKDTWLSCSISGGFPRPTHAWIVGWSFPLLRVSGGGMSIENGLNGCLCIFC